MATDEILHMPVADAYLCADCGTVSNQATRCPSCASEHGMQSLATVLNREAVVDEDALTAYETELNNYVTTLPLAPATPEGTGRPGPRNSSLAAGGTPPTV